MYNVIIKEIKKESNALESEAQRRVAELDAKILKLMDNEGVRDAEEHYEASKSGSEIVTSNAATLLEGSRQSDVHALIVDYVTEFSVSVGEHVTQRWWSLFELILTKYRDGSIMTQLHPPERLWPVFFPAVRRFTLFIPSTSRLLIHSMHLYDRTYIVVVRLCRLL
jgi:hypothetical protein